MERKRKNGKFVRESDETKTARRRERDVQNQVTAEQETLPAGRKLSLHAGRLRYCHKLVSHKVAEAMPAIVDNLIHEACHGSILHAKEFLKLASIERSKPVLETPRRTGKGFAQRLLDELHSGPALREEEE